jgi:hypothetical protein
MGRIGTKTDAAGGAGIPIAEPVQFLDREALRDPAARRIWGRLPVYVIGGLRDGAARS